MPIEQVTAFKSSDGMCHAGKLDAYKREIDLLYNKYPDVKRRGYSLAALDRAMGELDSWVGRAKLVQEQLATDKEVSGDVTASFNKLLRGAKGWLAEAKAIREQMGHEADPEVKGQIAREG